MGWALFFFLSAGCGAAIADTASPPPEPAPSGARAAELVHLVRQDCGSCHGMTLLGGLGPALTPEALHSRAPASLAAAIYYGRPGTPMPPWKPFMSESEALWIANQLKAGSLK